MIDDSAAGHSGRSDGAGDETPREGFVPLRSDALEILRHDGEVHRLRALATEAEQLAGLHGGPSESLPDRLERALLALRRQRDEKDDLQHRLELTLRALRAASRVAQSVSSAFRRETVLAAVPDALVRIFGAVTARVWMVGPGDRCGTCTQAARCADKTECLHLVALGERGPLDLALARVPIGPYSVGRVGQLRRVIATNDIASEPGLADPDWARVERVRSFAGHPLEHDGKLLGAVAMWSRSSIRDEMLEALAIIAQHASTAIVGAQLLAQSREVDRVKNEFISTASHELRTPLTSIKGALSLLLDGTMPFDPETTELLQISQRNADRLVRLVGDILDISKLEADKIEMRLVPNAPEELCRMALGELASISSRDDVKLHVEVEPGLPPVHTDADRVLQILTNLLSNAFKFSPAQGRVVLRAKLSGGSVRFEVQDSGPGVALEFRGKLFTKFAQSERTRQEQSGTGLGLAICQALIEKLGGEIGCDSVPGEGATFFFTLPVLEQR